MPSRRKSPPPSKKRLSGRTLRILVIHGPNLNLLGTREVNVYGRVSMREINQDLMQEARRLGVSLKMEQSNHEGEIVGLIGKSPKRYDGILINPAAYTHTSMPIRDALLAAALPAVEVLHSNIYKREEFRQRSLTAPACVGQITGFGKESYILGLKALASSLKSE